MIIQTGDARLDLFLDATVRAYRQATELQPTFGRAQWAGEFLGYALDAKNAEQVGSDVRVPLARAVGVAAAWFLAAHGQAGGRS